MDTLKLKKKLGLCMAIVALCCVSCRTTSSGVNAEYMLPNDSVTLNDSVLDIIWRANSVICTLQGKSPMDSTRTDTMRIVPNQKVCTLKYLLSDTRNFASNDIVFGLFSASCKYHFLSPKSRILCVEFDFGLKKWRILDYRDEEIFRSDMKENAYHFLRITQLLFPQDVTLNLLSNN